MFSSQSVGVDFSSQVNAAVFCSKSDGVDFCFQSDGVDFYFCGLLSAISAATKYLTEHSLFQWTHEQKILCFR